MTNLNENDLTYYKLNLINRWVVEVIDDDTQKPKYELTQLGSENVTVLCTIMPDKFPELSKVHVTLQIKEVMERLEKEKIITEYYKNNQQTYGMTEHGYNMMKILVWLLDIKKQKSYKQKQMISNGMTKGMSTTIKIMQGVVNFGQSMQPKSPPITTKKYNQLTKTKNAKRKKKRKVRLGTSGILSDLQKFSKLTN